MGIMYTYQGFRSWFGEVSPEAAKLLDAAPELQRRIMDLCDAQNLPVLTPEILTWIRRRARGTRGEFNADVGIPALRLIGYEARSLVVVRRMTTSMEDSLHKHGILRRRPHNVSAFIHGALSSQEATYIGGKDPGAVAALWAALEPRIRVGATKDPPTDPESGVLYVGSAVNIDPKTFPGWWKGKGVDRYQQEPPRWWEGAAYMLTPPYWFGTANGVRIESGIDIYEGPTAGTDVWKFLEGSGVAWHAERYLGGVEPWLPRGPRDPANAVHDRHCQACFELHAVIGARIAPHGYEFPDHAYKVSGTECAGSRAFPWEQAKDVAERILARLVDRVAPERRARVEHFEAGKPIRVAYTNDQPTALGQTPDEHRTFGPGDKEWSSAKFEAENAERHLWTGWGSIPWRRALLRTWVRSEERVKIPFITPDQLTPEDRRGMPVKLAHEMPAGLA